MPGRSEQEDLEESGRRPRPILDLSIRRKDEHTELHIDIGEQAEDFGAGNLAHLIAKLITALSDQVLPKLLDHLDPFRGFGQLPFGRCEHTFQSDDDEITRDQRTDFIRTPPHKLLFTFDDFVAD